MNDLTIPSQSQSSVSPLTIELAKMLSLVAPVTMSADQHTIWLASAVDALQDIRPDEVQFVSAEVRRTVTRPSQIVPEIARLVGERRKQQAKMREYEQAALPPPSVKKHIADRDRSKFTAEDWAELNEYLERMDSPVRYLSDGTRTGATA